ncbi:5911_t:CDS:2 [Acaulospora morrowiae]|uniref:5911_t:CDS:1 n=1 Tax=Acaulospora morrowiae TaxID=94023 RepID=A0A9N8WAG1_9GLOM|nr:5911_t:CDS:2 [Acaulospora morrowiae]
MSLNEEDKEWLGLAVEKQYFKFFDYKYFDQFQYIAGGTFGYSDVVGNVVQPFLPLITSLTIIIAETTEIYECAKYNKNICSSLMDRVNAADVAIKTLERKKGYNGQNFRSEVYYKTFIRFVDVMTRIKNYIHDVSTLTGFKRFTTANSARKKFNLLIGEFEATMNDLHFSTTIVSQEQSIIDAERLDCDLKNMSKFMETIGNGVIDANNNINVILEEVLSIKQKITNLETNKKKQNFVAKNLKVNHIEPNKLKEPLIRKETDRRGQTVKKMYDLMDVACKHVEIIGDNTPESQNLQRELAILGKLKGSPNIIKFFGLSRISDYQVMVFEWAELGTLKELYEKYDIGWCQKVQIALDICRGLVFLHTCEILHHDIRCANILMTSRLEAKIANFKYSRHDKSKTTEVKGLVEIVRWMAPEKLAETFQKTVRYSFQCEIYSFGMLLWELAFERYPYKYIDVHKIKEHVLNGGRERISWCNSSPDVQRIQKKFEKIIISAWQQDLSLRASLLEIFLKLSKLSSECAKLGSAFQLLPDGTIDLEGPKSKNLIENEFPKIGDFSFPLIMPLEEGIGDFSFPLIMPLEEGIKAHRRGERTTAWKCFNDNSNLGNTTAKYWLGHYLREGYPSGIRDLTRAHQLLKEAADDEIPDAQFRYALSLLSTPGVKFDRTMFTEYLTKAADAGNVAAQYILGDMYLNGKLLCPIYKATGMKYIRLAAIGDHPEAIKLLTKEKSNL